MKLLLTTEMTAIVTNNSTIPSSIWRVYMLMVFIVHWRYDTERTALGSKRQIEPFKDHGTCHKALSSFSPPRSIIAEDI